MRFFSSSLQLHRNRSQNYRKTTKKFRAYQLLKESNRMCINKDKTLETSTQNSVHNCYRNQLVVTQQTTLLFSK